MAYSATFTEGTIGTEQATTTSGWLLLEFGTNWCSHCMTAQWPLKRVLKDYPDLHHIKEEDGPGRKLGRYFHVKLWPTFILLRDGTEVARLVRPTTEATIRDMLEAMTAF